ncbi:MAG TPA: hypothetical protein VEZ42_10765 [Pseudonocardia sp.]|nr:hypothetical protein [Pseudonocardia sp.]
MEGTESIVGARQLAELLLGRRVRRLPVDDLRPLEAHLENEPAPTG